MTARTVAATLLAVVIGIAGALLIVHWAAVNNVVPQ